MKELLKKVDILQFMVAVTVLFVFLLVVLALIYRVIPDANKEILIHVLGIIEGAIMTLVSFYYGSSKGSQKKSDTISDALKSENNETVS